MTRFEEIKQMTEPRELGHELCDLIPDCKNCPVGDNCDPYAPKFETGFTKWLKEEDKC
jgi:hypothetical protein